MRGKIELKGTSLDCEIDRIKNTLTIEDKEEKVLKFGNYDSTRVDEYIRVTTTKRKFILRIPTANFSRMINGKVTYYYDFIYIMSNTFQEDKIKLIKFYGSDIDEFLYVQPNKNLNKLIKKCGTGMRMNFVSNNGDNYISISFNKAIEITSLINEVFNFNRFLSFLSYKFNVEFNLIQILDTAGETGELNLRDFESYDCKNESINYNYFSSVNILELYSNFKKLENIFEFYPRCEKCDDLWTRDRVVGVASSLESVLDNFYRKRVPSRVTENMDAYNKVKGKLKEMKTELTDDQYAMFSSSLGMWKKSTFGEKISFAIDDIQDNCKVLLENIYSSDYRKYNITSRITTFRNSVAHGVGREWYRSREKEFNHVDYIFAIYIIYYLTLVKIGYKDFSLINQIIFKLVGECNIEEPM